MPIFRLGAERIFPPVELAEPGAPLAVGGDLSVERLLLAYESGIFPWFSEGDPILWWAPDPRFVLFPDKLKVSKSMQRVVKSGRFRITYDRAFRSVIAKCRIAKRKGQGGTWITAGMREAYCRLHEAGYAHSVEAWSGDALAGGLYGVSLGRCFFGESMFADVSNASKAALVDLVAMLDRRDFALIDCQVHSPHLAGLGAEYIPRARFSGLLAEALRADTIRGNWGERIG
ncbi:MAG: leucyl/phenylalanyl-tRNA--protein transferase [Kiritimatiellae bacterium]|nr:leucyl/phenylalanyl-tRNA--protein transferase [Kiritimatiellia bacterium]